MSNHFIQQYTADQIPFYVNMRSGVTSWTLPAHAGPDAVKYITHLTDQGVPYYEDVQQGTTSWTLPLEKLSTAARRNSMAIKKMDRRETDAFMAEEEKANGINNANNSHNSNTAVTKSNRGGGRGAGLGSLEEEEEDDESDSSSVGRGKQMTVSRAPFSTSTPVGGTETERNTDHSAISSARTRAGSSGSASAGRASSKVSAEERKQQQGDSKRFSNMATLSSGAGGGAGAFSDDESESNTTATSASSGLVAGDQRTLRAQKRKEALDSAAASSPAVAPVVRGKNRSMSPANTTGTGGGSGGSNIVVHKAMVRNVFEQYNEAGEAANGETEDIITPQGLQELCLDYGTFLSMDDIVMAMKSVDANFDGVFQYEEFMVWWRNNPFSQMKKNSPETQKKFEAAAAYKLFDPQLRGHLTRQEFASLHREISRAKLTALSLDDCIGHLDAGHSGLVHFNDYMALIEHPPAAGGGAGHVLQRGGDDNKGGNKKPGQGTLSKFFGSFSSKKDKGGEAEGGVELVAAKEHVDYAKYFRLVDFGGNIVDVRGQMRQAGLDDALIHSPNKMIPAQSVKQDSGGGAGTVLVKKQSSTFGSIDLEGDEDEVGDFEDDESDGMSFGSSLVSGKSEQQRQAEESAFTNSFKIKSKVPVDPTPPQSVHSQDGGEDEEQDQEMNLNHDESDGMVNQSRSVANSQVNIKLSDIVKNHPSPSKQQGEQPVVVETFLRKPLGLTLGENEPDEPRGVHVSRVVEGGHAAQQGQIRPGMVLLRACGHDVTAMDFDEVMDILRDADKAQDLCLVFEGSKEQQEEEQGDEEDEEEVVIEKDEEEVEEEEEDDDDDDEDDEVEETGKDLWATHEQQYGNESRGGLEEEKQEVLIEDNVDADKVVLEDKEEEEEEEEEEEDKETEGSRSGTENSSNDESEEEKNAVAAKADPLARANSMFGGLSDSEDDDGEEDEKGTEEQTEQKVTEDAASSTSSTGFKALRLAAMMQARDKKAAEGAQPSSSKPAAPLENSAIQSRVRAPPRRSPSLPRSNSLNNNSNSNTSLSQQQPQTQQAVEAQSSTLESTGLPRRQKGVSAAGGSQRRYDRMLGSEEEQEQEEKEKEDIPGGEQTAAADTSSSSLPRRKRSIVKDPNERRYGRMFNDQQDEQQSEPGVDRQQQQERPHSELRMGTVKAKTGFPLSALSLGDASEKKSEQEQEQQNDEKGDGKGGQQSAALPRRGGSNLTRQLKSLRSRRALEERDNRDSAAGAAEKEQQEEKADVAIKRHTRSGKILNKQLNILWQKEGKEVIQKHKLEEQEKEKDKERAAKQVASKIITENERVKPEEFRRRRQSFTQSTPLVLPPEEKQTLEEQEQDEQSLPSAIVEENEDGSSHCPSTSTATASLSSFAPSVTRKPVSTFDMSPSLTLPTSPAPSSSSSSSPRPHQSKTAGPVSDHDSVGDRSRSSIRSRHSQCGLQEDEQEQKQKQAVDTIDAGCQSDYVNLIDEKYLNSYQMLLGEKQEVADMQERLHAEMQASREQLRDAEVASMQRVEAYERESLARVAEEEALLRARMEQVEDIIQAEKSEIDQQWAELRAAEQEAYAVHALKTQELLELMHLVSAHHERLAGDKRKIARQRLHLDMALQDINRFTKFSPDMSGKIGSVKYVNPRVPNIGPPLSSAPSPHAHSQAVNKGFNSSASRLMPSPARSPGPPSSSSHSHSYNHKLSPNHRTSSQQSLQSFGSSSPRLTRSQI